MKLILICLALFCFTCSKAQLPETDIFLSTIKKESGKYIFSKPENITNRKGYDNQPSFTKDGKKILFVSIRDTLQSDVFSYDLKTKSISQVTNTRESEYSPAFTPNNKFISVVCVDADSGQRFYLIPDNNYTKRNKIKNTDSIGYACWLNDTMLAMFILGPAHTLQVLNLVNFERKLIASDIGRCMKLSPDGKRMYFVLKANDAEWYIYSMDCKSFALTRIAQTLNGSEDFAVLPDESIILGNESKLYLLEKSGLWTMLADFSSDLPGFYRIAVNESCTQLALVAYTGKKP
jgi:tricorn protease-like protein